MNESTCRHEPVAARDQDATETLAISRPRRPADEVSLPPGTTIGRYVILGLIGAGGMGRVYAAYDPDLDRRVALKLVRPASRSRDAPKRLLREAQAMAQLTHPHVVSVYDVGTHRRQIFLAMEFVEGGSLRDWMRAKRHRHQEVLEVFRQAGRGLEAAHAAGLVHRDFKPSNVLVADDGRVCVADLGLARLIERRPEGALAMDEATEPAPPDGLTDRLLTTPLTRSEAPVGSPIYMAPEQYARGEVDARSDQFSFCVALSEALFGRHPFEGSEDGVGGQHLPDARRSDPPDRSQVPRRIRAVVDRGLSIEPDGRYPSMSLLLDDLVPEPRQRGRLWWAASIAAMVLTLGLLIWQWVDADRLETGRLAEQRLVGLWDAEQKNHLRTAIESSDSSLAEETWGYLEPWLEAYVADWSTRWIAARDTVRLTRDTATDLPFRRLICLDQRLVEFKALTRLLASSEPEVTAGAVLAAQNLPDLSTCSRVETAETVSEPEDPDTRRRLAAVRSKLAWARALESAEVPARGLALAQQALPEAERLDFLPVTAQAHWILGKLHLSSEEFTGAAEHLEEGLWATLTLGHVEDAAAIAVDLTELASREARRDDQRRWLRLAEALGRRLGSSPRLLTRMGFQRGRLLHDTARYEEALAQFHRTLASARQAHGPSHEAVAEVLFGLGATSYALTRFADAVGFFQEAQEMVEEIFGPRHPETAEVLNGLGVALRRRGRDDEAIEVFERTLEIRRRTLGVDHSAVAATLNNLANVHGDRQEYARAIELLQQAEPIFRQALGPDHPRVAICLFNIGRLSYERGSWEKAGTYLDQAIAVTEKAEGMEHPNVAEILVVRSSVRHHQGDPSGARSDLARAEQIYLEALGPESRRMAEVWGQRAAMEASGGNLEGALDDQRRSVGLLQRVAAPDDPMTAAAEQAYADYLLVAGRHREALAVAERSLAARERSSLDPAILAPYRWTLARARLLTGGDRQAALTLARQAREAFATIENRGALRVEIDTWLAQHAGELR